MPSAPSHGHSPPGAPSAAAAQTLWSSYSHVAGLYVPEVQATGRWVVAFGLGECQATHSSSANGSMLPAPPVELSITPLPFASVQSSCSAQNLVTPPLRLATATARPSTLTLVREGLPL